MEWTLRRMAGKNHWSDCLSSLLKEKSLYQQSEWSLRWTSVADVKTISLGNEIYIKPEKEAKKFKLFGSSNVEKKIIYLRNPQRNVYLGETMQKLILNYSESS